MREIEDAKATLRMAVQTAIVDTCLATGLRAGAASETLIDAILLEIQSPDIAWALRRLVCPDEVK